MKINKFLLSFFFMIILASCSKDKDEVRKSILKEKSLDLQVLETYQEGMSFLEEGDALYAAKQFNEAELLFPQSKWAPKSALMAAYAYYSQDYLNDAIAELERFLKVYPKHKNLDYAYYLLGVSYYEQIVDEKKDLQSIILAKKYFEMGALFVAVGTDVSTFLNSSKSLLSEYKELKDHSGKDGIY